MLKRKSEQQYKGDNGRDESSTFVKKKPPSSTTKSTNLKDFWEKTCTQTKEDPFDYSTSNNFFASFISPFETEPFFRNYWEKKPLVLSNRSKVANIVGHLFSKQILDSLAVYHKLEYVTDVCFSRYRNQERETMNGVGIMKVSDFRKFMSKQKATVQFHQPQRFQDTLWRIMEQLESRFQCLVGANVYITPGGSQGLAPHFDDVEVFIMQLEGEKRWRLYKPPQDLPREYSNDLSQSDIGEPTHDFILKPGDLLYFPRGTVHQAVTPDTCSHSTHITFSTYQQHTWSDYLSKGLLKMLSSAFESSVDYRRGLPLNFLSNTQLSTTTDGVVQHLISSLSNQVVSSHREVIQDMKLEFIANRLRPYKYDNESTDIQMPPKGSVLTHMRLKHPGHTCICIEESGPKIFSITPIGPEILEEEDEDEEEDEEEEEEEAACKEENDNHDENYFFHVYHSVDNLREYHMMVATESKPAGYKFPLSFLEAFRLLEKSAEQWVSLVDLKIDAKIYSGELIFADLVEYKYDI